MRQGYNIIMLYSADASRILMCRRRKDPYGGLANLIGGKIEPGEDGLSAAYREMGEESGVSRDDADLTHVMDFVYYLQDCYVEVYAGRLKRDIAVTGDENELFWSDLGQDFFDMGLYAGEGNIGHMIEQVKMYEKEIFKHDLASPLNDNDRVSRPQTVDTSLRLKHDWRSEPEHQRAFGSANDKQL